MRITALCVGGPLNGMFKADDRETFEVPEQPRGVPTFSTGPIGPVEVRIHVYKRLHLGPSHSEVVWHPTTMKPSEVIATLIRGYNRSNI